jgi:hypothetical protein
MVSYMANAEQQIKNCVASPRTYCADLQPVMQSLLRTLADIEFDFEQERERLESSTSDSRVKALVLEKLRARHRERREPYDRQLALLQERIRPTPDWS